MGRFINADGIMGANGGFLSYNLFSYCSNNPVIFSDHSGFIQRYTIMSDSGAVDFDIIDYFSFDLGINKPLDKGWSYRIDPPDPEKKLQRHIHVFKDGEEYSQNNDGTPHEKSNGKPSKKIREKLKDKSGWDWDKKETNSKNKNIEIPTIPICDPVYDYENENQYDHDKLAGVAVGVVAVGFSMAASGMSGFPNLTGGSSILDRFACK